MLENGISLLIGFLISIFGVFSDLKFPGTNFSFLAIFVSFLMVEFAIKFFQWLIGFKGLKDNEVKENDTN